MGGYRTKLMSTRHGVDLEAILQPNFIAAAAENEWRRR